MAERSEWMKKHGRRGMYGGNIYTFTHRDPKSGKVYSNEIPVLPKEDIYGAWVYPDEVKWIKEESK